MRKILRNLRTWLIHKLGGVTLESGERVAKEYYYIGYYEAYKNHLDFADSLYGLPADEWCDKMYQRVKSDFRIQVAKNRNMLLKIVTSNEN